MLRQAAARSGLKLRWAPTAFMAAGALTKESNHASALLRVLLKDNLVHLDAGATKAGHSLAVEEAARAN